MSRPIDEKIALMIVKFDEGLKSSNGFKKAVDSVAAVVKKLATIVWDAATKITNFLFNIKKGTDSIVKFVSPAFEKLASYIKKFVDSLSGQDLANVGVIGTLLIAAKKLDSVQNVFEGFLDNFSGLFGAIKGGIENLGGLKDVLSDLQSSIKATTLMQIAIAVGILAGSLKLLASIDGRDMAKSLEAMAVTLVGLVGTLKLISKIDMSGMSSLKAATSLVGLGVAVLVISAALKVFASINPEELARGMMALVGVVATLTVSIVAMSKFGGKINTSAGSLLALSASVVILAQAVKTLSNIDGKDLPKALLSLAAIMGSLAAFLKIVNGAKFGPASAVGVVILSGAILIMVEGIRQIASIPVNTLVNVIIN